MEVIPVSENCWGRHDAQALCRQTSHQVCTWGENGELSLWSFYNSLGIAAWHALLEPPALTGWIDVYKTSNNQKKPVVEIARAISPSYVKAWVGNHRHPESRANLRQGTLVERRKKIHEQKKYKTSALVGCCTRCGGSLNLERGVRLPSISTLKTNSMWTRFEAQTEFLKLEELWSSTSTPP